MRILSAGIQHETNTFAVTPTTIDDFIRDSECGPDFAAGEKIFELYDNTGTIHGGYIDGMRDTGAELVPLLVAKAQPSGIVTKECFDSLLGQILERMTAAREQGCDGVLLDLHGAMVTAEYEDAEGAIIAAVRELVGPAVPIVTTLDLHANITAHMAEASDVIIGFDTYPHVDMRERGREAMNLLARIIRGEIKPVQVFRQLPLITLPPMQCTLREPMQSLMKSVHEREQQPGVLTATVAMGFPFADIRDAGVSILVTVDEDEKLANRQADELAQQVWNLRDELQPQLTTIEDVMKYCDSLTSPATFDESQLVIFADGSDNPGGGAPCDGTVALKALIDADFQGAVVGVLYDPETVEQAHRAGVGATIDAHIGGKTDVRHGSPIDSPAYVRTLSDGKFTYRGPMRRGFPGDFGKMAVLTIGGVEIVLATRRQQLLDAEMLRIVGISPETRRLLVVKSAVHFRADLGPLAIKIFDADTPGIHRPDFSAMSFEKLRRPIYPLDRDVSF
ncbi:MAG: M81 family metallopeptidase [Planctomycetaceae bacterium]